MAQMKGTTVGYYYYSISMQVCVEQQELVSINANLTRTLPGPLNIIKI